LLQNLVSNAVKFSEGPEPLVSVSAERLDGHWRFTVADNGAGIPPELGRRIFEPFERLDRKQPGTGIGLAICKRVVERHGGVIHAESGPSGGNSFVFTIPA
jgi:signal transduction histidine kinase